MNPLQTLISILRSRLMGLVTRIRLLFSPGYVMARLNSVFRFLIEKVLNVRPKDKDDYYPISKWLVSKRLAYAVVIIIGIICAFFLYRSRTALLPGRGDDHIKTYRYNSILLKYAKGEVRIKGKSGYIAYEGKVKKAAANGDGTLKNPEGVVVYEGNFEDNKYEGKGKEYYDNGTLRYAGDFHENLYNGEGKLYHANGSLSYDGEFSQNMKEGQGKLYDISGDPVFEGEFSRDRVLFSSLIGKSSEDMAECYTGERKLYQFDNERVRVLEDLNAMTEEITEEDSIDENATVAAVYVLEDKIRIGSSYLKSFLSLEQALGAPTYVGESYATLPEILMINRLNDASDEDVLGGEAEITTTDVFKEYTQVEEYDEAYKVYLHTYAKDGMVYNFVSNQGDNAFSFYYILPENEKATEE